MTKRMYILFVVLCGRYEKEMGMQENYVQIMIESLKKKEEILSSIGEKNLEQKAIVEKEEISFEEFDHIMDEKAVLIRQLEVMDRGFESLYEKVKEEIQSEEGKIKYGREIKQMQESIRNITEKSASIQVQEKRNKQIIEAAFRSEKEKLKVGKISSKAAVNYYKTMNQTNFVSPQFLDKKK